MIMHDTLFSIQNFALVSTDILNYKENGTRLQSLLQDQVILCLGVLWITLPTQFSLVTADINECDTNNGGCDHNCTNSVGSYMCSCTEGFFLDGNMHSCLGKEGSWFCLVTVHKKQFGHRSGWISVSMQSLVLKNITFVRKETFHKIWKGRVATQTDGSLTGHSWPELFMGSTPFQRGVNVPLP